jgi:hypothetical protein
LDHIHEIVRLQKVVVKCQDLRNDVKFIKEPALVWKREYAVCVMPSSDPVRDMLDNEEMNILEVSATSPWISALASSASAREKQSGITT